MAFQSRFKDKMKNIGKSNSNADNRFFAENFKEDGTYHLRLTCDKNGTTFAEYTQHTVSYKDGQGRDKKYVHICCKTKGESCPTCDKVKQIWDSAGGAKEIAQEKLKGFIDNKNVKVANVKVIKSPFNEEVENSIKLFKINGIVFKSIKKQSGTYKEAKDTEFIEADPFDPHYGLNWFYKYKKPSKENNNRPEWETKFMKTVNNITGDNLGVGVKEDESTGNIINYSQTDKWADKAEKFVNDNEDKVTKFINDNTFDLNEYMYEIKNNTPSEDEVMKNIGSVLFGNMTNKENKEKTFDNKKQNLYKEDEDLEDEVEEKEESVSEEENDNSNSETTLDDDDDLPF